MEFVLPLFFLHLSFFWCFGKVVLRDDHETYLYNFALLKTYFYIVKMGFTGVNIIFLISAQK